MSYQHKALSSFDYQGSFRTVLSGTIISQSYTPSRPSRGTLYSPQGACSPLTAWNAGFARVTPSKTGLHRDSPVASQFSHKHVAARLLRLEKTPRCLYGIRGVQLRVYVVRIRHRRGRRGSCTPQVRSAPNCK